MGVGRVNEDQKPSQSSLVEAGTELGNNRLILTNSQDFSTKPLLSQNLLLLLSPDKVIYFLASQTDKHLRQKESKYNHLMSMIVANSKSHDVPIFNPRSGAEGGSIICPGISSDVC